MSTPVLECPHEWDEFCGCSGPPCWPRPDTNCCPDLQTDASTPPERVALIERSLRMAVETLWRLSGRQFGACPVTVRPCRDSCASTSSYGYWSGSVWMPVLEGGKWFNESCSTCPAQGCSCVTLCEVTLPAPVAAVVEVRIDGQVVDPADYRVDDHRKLVGQNGLCWPTCQDLSQPAGGPGSFTVTYRLGTPVPVGGLWAAGMLACQFVKACSSGGGGDCALPANAQRIVREGVTLELDPVLINGDGFATGIPEVDAWLTSVNPFKAKGPSRVYSVDRPRPRTTTWPCT